MQAEAVMDKKKWKTKITKLCKDAGTYETFFEPVIDTLAGIMEQRDKAHEQFVSSGSSPTIIHTNKAKEKNVVKNPILVLELDLNSQALAYWRDLGLTPSGFKKMDIEKDRSVSLEQVLAGLVNGE